MMRHEEATKQIARRPAVLRDKYFHGSPFREEDLIKEAQPVFYLIEHHPEIIADALLDDCELALARWANDASPGRDAARARQGT